MNVLITGGAGYIGSILVPTLLDRGYHITVLDNFMYGQDSLLPICYWDTLEIVRGDCRDEETLKPLLTKADVIIPLAAIVGMPACAADKTAAITTNLHAIALLYRLASKSQMILMPTTNSGYGIGNEKACTEESPLNPISLYGITKVEAEKTILSRENSITFRLATAFGVSPRMRLDLLVNDFTWRAVKDGFVIIFEGNFRRNHIHVQDAAQAFVHGIENFDKMRGRPYNVGLEGTNLTKIQLCEIIRRVLADYEIDFLFKEAEVGSDPDKRDYLISSERILATGWKPEWSLERGIRELVKAYRMMGGRERHRNA